MNYSFQQPIFKDNETIENANLTQAVPDTEISPGVTGLTFIKCNLVNCKIPADAIALSCNNTQVSRCTNLNPYLIDYGVVACAEDCQHRIGDKKEWVTILGNENKYIELKKDELKTDATQVRIIKTIDEFGITRQVFEKEEFIYEDIIS